MPSQSVGVAGGAGFSWLGLALVKAVQRGSVRNCNVTKWESRGDAFASFRSSVGLSLSFFSFLKQNNFSSGICVCVCLCMRVCVCVRVYVYLCVCVFVIVSVCLCVSVCECICMCFCLCVFVCVSVFACLCVCVHACLCLLVFSLARVSSSFFS